MPLFLYQCDDCENTFETLIRDNHNDLIECPKCHGLHTKKQIGRMSFILKGDGWASTGYSKPPVPVNTDSKGTVAGFAHIADRKTGKSLGYKPTGVAEL